MKHNKSVLEILRRLTAMGADELRLRSLQEVTKYWDLTRYRLGVGFADRRERHQPCANPRFFFRPQDIPQIANWIRKHLPQTAGEIVERAERICIHRFDLLGYTNLDYGAEIDWHLDIVHGKRAPQRPWFKIRYLEFEEVGDCKVVWELNRHQQLVALAKAYRLTGREHFLQELVKQWFHWREHNPYPIGINWASSLEVAFRSLSWLWVWHLVQECPLVPQRFFLDLRRALSLNARHIQRFLSTYFSPNTHLLGEAVALFFIGTMCPELSRARYWQERGWQIVLQQAEQQVRHDGMHFEQSVYYHTYATDFFLHASVLAKLNEIYVPPSFERTLEKMLEVLCRLGRSGVVPQFGDDDGGRVFDPQRNRAEHLLDPLATGAVLFRRPDFKAVAAGLREETIWLTGIVGAELFETLAVQQQRPSSFVLESSGIHVSASSDSAQQQLIIDSGPQGAGRCGHGHADALSVQLSMAGQRVFVDPGTFSYVDDRGGRYLFRCTAAHNTLQVDGRDQAEPAGPFSWHQLPIVRAEQWIVGDTFDLFVGSHNGYNRFSTPIQHTRYVFHLKSRFWLIRDVVRGSGLHKLDLYWHAAPHLTVSDAGAAVLVSDRGWPLVTLVPTASHNWLRKVNRGWYSPVYGVKEPCSVLQFSSSGSLPMEFASVLTVHLNGRAEAGTLTALDAEKNGVPVVAYAHSASGYTDYMFFAEQDRLWQRGNWASDASFLLWEMDPAKNLSHLVVCNGSYVEVGDHRVFTSNRPVVSYEWRATPTGNESYCSDHSALIYGPDRSSVSDAQISPQVGIVGAYRS